MAQVLGSLFGFGSVTVNELFGVNAAYAAEGISHAINYQGKLMDADGKLVADGDYDIIFSLYDTASAGTRLWTANGTTGSPSAVSVSVQSGLFSILLGDVGAGMNEFSDGFFNNDSLYLGITVGADTEMTPRKRLSAVPYAYNSEMLQGQYASNTVATTGGDLFALHQGGNNSASAVRTVLGVYTSGTSDTNDYLIRANSGSDVFSVNREGNTNIAGTLNASATSTFTDISLSGRVDSDLLPYITDTYNLGNSSYRWLGLNVANVSSTNIDALGYVSTTNLYVDGVQITGATPNLDQVTTEGNITSNAIGVAGVSSTGNILPTASLTYDLGSTSRRWNDVYLGDLYATGTVQGGSMRSYGALQVDGATTLNGTVGLGNAVGDIITATGRFGSALVPNANTYNLGLVTTANRWGTAYLNGALYATGTVQGGSMRSYGALQVDGATTLNGTVGLGNSTGDTITATGYFGSGLIPSLDNTYSLGSSALRWKNIYAVNVSSTNIDALNYVSTTNLYVDGVQITGATPNLDQVTTEGNITSNEIGVGGVSSTGNILPTTSLTYDLGSTSRRWNDAYLGDLYATGTIQGGTMRSYGALQVDGATTLNGTVGLGNAVGDIITATGRFGSALVPNANTYNLGLTATANRWGSAYLNGALYATGTVQGGTMRSYGNLRVDGTTTLNTVEYTWPGASSNGLLRNTGGTLTWDPATYLTAVAGTSLDSTKFWVGNASNQATAVAMSGDATMSNTGEVAVVNDSHNHTGTTLSIPGTSLTDARLWVGNVSGAAAEVLMSGDGTLSNAGVLDVSGLDTGDFASANISQWTNNAGYLTSLGNAFVDGGNTFGNTGDLGTNDGFALNFRTNNATRVVLDTTGNLYPLANNAYDLGKASNSWNNLYVSSTAYFGGVGGTSINFATSAVMTATPGSYPAFTFYPTAKANSLFFVGDDSLNTALLIKNATHTAIAADWLQDFALTVGGNVGPYTNLAYDLGSSSNRWKDIWASSTYIGASTWNLRQNASGYFTIADVGGSEKVTVDTSGKVGIGTSAPARELHIADGIIRVDRSSDSASFMLHRYDGVDPWKTFFFGVNATGTNDGYFFISDLGSAVTGGGAQRFVIDNTGNVGIGTSTPNSKLHIYNNQIDNVVEDMLTLETYRGDFGSIEGNAILFKNLDSNNGINEARIKVVTENDGSLGINNESSSSFIFNMTNSGAPTDRVIFRGDGRVGIGTLLPERTLHISGTQKISGVTPFIELEDTGTSKKWYYGLDDANFWVREDSTAGVNERFTVAAGGNVGIGNTSPASLLTVGSGGTFQVNTSGDIVKIKDVTYTWPDANASGILRNSGTGTLTWDTTTYLTSAMAFMQGGNSFGTAAVLGTNDNNTLSFETNGTSRATLGTDGGLTLLGTANTEQLTVKAYSSQSNVNPLIVFQNSAGSVIGQIHTDHDANVFMGVQSGILNSGTQNSFIGSRAGYRNTSGNGNTGLGYYALYAPQTGDYNVAIGALAGRGTGGDENTFVGAWTGFAGGPGVPYVSNYNTALGSRSMQNTQTGSYNTSLGSSVMYSNTTGASNTAIGFESMYTNQIGTRNVAVGTYAMRNQSGVVDEAVAVGYKALYSIANTNGVAIGAHSFENAWASPGTAVGDHAFYSLTSGHHNTGLGGSAGYYAGGSYNTAIGDSSLFALSGSTGSYNTAVGASSMITLTSGASNTALGYKSLYENSIGYRNTGVGAESMYGNNDGFANTAIGNRSLYGNSHGDHNSIMGDSAAYSLEGSYNTINGSAAGYQLLAGNHNTAMGYRSMLAGASADASFNVAIGNFSLQAITSGASNTAVGYYSLKNNTTGFSNTAVGLNALQSNIGGFQNVALGNASLGSATNGLNNNAIGSGALGKLTSGNYNSVLGGLAGYRLDTGSYNVGVGYRSLSANTIGGTYEFNYNSAIGAYALGKLTTGASNTAVGYEALFSLTTGYNNIALGNNAAGSITGSTYNIAIGDDALGNATVSAGNIAMGSASMRDISGTASNNVSIGNYSMMSATDADFTVAIGYYAAASSTGNSNVAIGQNALANDTAGNNVAIGSGAGSLNTGGIELTAIGYNAADANVTGYYNTALGSSALTASQYGDNNTAVGADTLYLMNGGFGNTAVGSQSSYRLGSTADNNTSLGYNALYGTSASYSTGDDNTAIGQSTLYSNSTGYQNTAIGSSALYLNSSGIRNVGLGSNSVARNTTGDYNIGIGYSALYYSQTGTDNIAIGRNALAGTADYASYYNIAIGTYSLDAIGSSSYGNVGIGYGTLSALTTPNYNTAVGYNASTNLTLGTANVSLGANSMNYNQTGNYNVYLGHYAGYGVANNSNSSNVGIGYYAMSGITTGNDNVAIGDDSSRDITTGSYNTLIGGRSGYYTEGSTYNTAVGYNALNGTNGSTDSYNTAIGSYALDGLSGGGHYNTALGYGAGGSITSGDYNVAIGYAALDSQTTAGENIAIGYNALGVANSTGLENLAIGTRAGDVISSGDWNVMIGNDAGDLLQTGSANTFVGYHAGNDTGTYTGNSTLVGYGSDVTGNYTNASAFGSFATVSASDRAMIGNGQTVGGSSGWNNWSDSRLKYDINDSNLGLDFINKLRVRTFRYTTTSNMAHAGVLEDGFVAQEVEAAMNDLSVNFSGLGYPENPNDYYRLDYAKFTVPLVNATQELYASSSPLWNGIAIDPNFATTSEPFMQVDMDGNIAYKGVSITSQGIATSSTQAFDSFTFSYKGSAWNTDTAQEITTSFDAFNNTISATSSELKFIYTTGTGFTKDLLTISNSGDVRVSGDLHVGRRLYLGSKVNGEASTSTYIFVDDTLSPTSTYIATNADGWQTETTYDYAERYESSEELIPGDLVTADPTGVNLVKRATSPTEPLLGIVSTKPGFVTGRHYEGWYPVALAGRVPTRVSTMNGAIQAGDYITATHIPGVGAKAKPGENVIGMALESYSSPEEGLISVFVQAIGQNNNIENTYSTVTYGPEQPAEIPGVMEFAMIKAGQKEVNISFDSLGAFPSVIITPYGSVNGSCNVTNVKDNGFTIVLSEEQSFDLLIYYEIKLPKGNKVILSDGTIAEIDTLTGQVDTPIEPEPDPEPEPEVEPIQETDPVISDPEPATSSTTMVSSTDTTETDVTASSTWPVTGGDVATSTTQNGV
ncbi:MAG: tail fiber domain-containing protein [Patescibacteria group bacterium]|nr:tail fiber domain-containing protein [Patescibacteria group bacterium]